MKDLSIKLTALIQDLYPPSGDGLIIDRRQEVERITGDSTSGLYCKMSDGRFPRGVKLGPNSVGWPRYESLINNRARLAALNDDELRLLVRWLVEQRQVPTKAA